MTHSTIKLALGLSCLLAACAEDPAVDEVTGAPGELNPQSEPPTTPVEPVGAQPWLDVLFVIDNSGSMSDEQEKLAREIPRLVQVLTSGDRYAGREDQVPPGLSDKSRRFVPVQSLHLGVISTNLGGMDEPSTQQPAIQACAGAGDEGKLQHSVEVAVAGVVAGRGEFAGYSLGEVVLAPKPECAQPALPTYQVFGEGLDAAAASAAFECTARLGVRGCPFEQQLESMWRALAPTSGPGAAALYSFNDEARGQGDGYNRGFLRPDAALAIIHLTDEDDCSITEAGKVLFDPSRAAGEHGPLNLRCGLRASDADLVRPVQRYADALRSLKPGHPERVLYAAITGVPQGPLGALDALLAQPSMQFTEDPVYPSMPKPVCQSQVGERVSLAYPARRMVQLAQQLGAGTLVKSICDDDYAAGIDSLVNMVAPLMGE